MSKENVATAQALFPNAIDLVSVFADAEALEGLRALIHPDFEAVFETRNIPMAAASYETIGRTGRPTVHGFDALVSTWRDWLSAWETWFITPTEFVDVDDERVLVLMQVRARSKTHGVEMPIEGANLLTIRDRRLVLLELFLDHRKAREAAGL